MLNIVKFEHVATEECLSSTPKPSRIAPGTAKVAAIPFASHRCNGALPPLALLGSSLSLPSLLVLTKMEAQEPADLQVPYDALFWESLHLVEHVREGGLELECLLDLVGAHIGIFPVFEETRALVLADELDEFLRLGFPIFGETLEIFENRSSKSNNRR